MKRYRRVLLIASCAAAFQCVAQTVEPTPAPLAIPDLSSPTRRFAGPPGMWTGKDKQAWETEPLPRRDLFDFLVRTKQPAPASDWVDREKEVFSKVLRREKSAVFVAPFQVQGYGFDRSTRSLMSAQLAQAMDATTPNPYVVQRALGDGQRSIPLNDLFALATAVDAAKLLVVFVGYERFDRMLVTVKLFAREGNSWAPRESGTRSWTDTPFSDDNPPAVAFRALIPQILEFAAVAPRSRAKAEAPQTAARAEFPRDVEQAFLLADRDPVSRALVFQLLGSLSPAAPERQRERMFEQALLAVDDIAQQRAAAAADIAFIRARSLYYLHSRPAAIAALGEASTPATVAFRQFLDGNLPDTEEAVAKIADPMIRLMLEIDLQDMRIAYRLPAKKKESAFVAALLEKHPDWKTLVSRRLAEGDPWAVQDNVAIKMQLDRAFPVKGFDAETISRGSVALGQGIDLDELGLSAFEHVSRARLALEAPWRCIAPAGGCARAGYLDLLEALAIANAVRSVLKITDLQAIPAAAMARVDALSKKLGGQPDYLVARGRALLSEYEYGQPGARSALLDSNMQVSSAAAYLEQGQSATSRRALVNMGWPSGGSTPFILAYVDDFPRHTEWLTDSHPVFANPGGARVVDARTALMYSGLSLDAARQLLASKQPGDKEFALEQLSKRFRGHPDRSALQIQDRGGDAQMARLEANLKDRPDLWANYSGVGHRQITTLGDYDAAARTFRSFPGFKDRAGYDAVDLSNDAYEAGSLFFWAGHFDAAREFYQIAADLDTGSNASITSALRLKLLDGNYEEATEISLQRARRYDSAYAYRDYLAFLFVMGFGKDAWAAFNQLNSRLDNPQVWLAAHVGHRMERKTWKDLKPWLLAEPIRSSGVRKEKFALAYAVMLSAIDRTPSADLPQVLTDIEGEPTTFSEPKTNTITMPHTHASAAMTVQRSAFRVAERGPFVARVGAPSQHVYFARAYVALRSGKFDEAVREFDAMAEFYPIEGDYLARIDPYALSYFAWASAKSGDNLRFEKFLNSLPDDKRGFDFHIAMAFFTGLRGDADSSIAHLNNAFNRRPFTERRPIFTEYQWAEACEWLFEATGKTQYRDMAIQWAKVNQKVQPMYAWAYAIEAKLTTSEVDRIRALGFALYLDPLSERIAKFSEPTRQRAQKSFAASNPFKPAAVPGGKGRAAADPRGSGSTSLVPGFIVDSDSIALLTTNGLPKTGR